MRCWRSATARRPRRSAASSPCPDPRGSRAHRRADGRRCRRRRCDAAAFGIGDGRDMRRHGDLGMVPQHARPAAAARSGRRRAWRRTDGRCRSHRTRSSSIRWPPRAALMTKAPLGSSAKVLALRMPASPSSAATGRPECRCARGTAPVRPRPRNFRRRAHPCACGSSRETWKSRSRSRSAHMRADLAQAQNADARVFGAAQRAGAGAIC